MKLITILLAALSVSGVLHAQSLLFFEDWDTTPPIPDDLRGWGYGAVAQNGFFFESGGNPGGFIRQPPTLGSQGLFTNKPMGVSPIAGDANYLELEISRVCVDLRAFEGSQFPDWDTWSLSLTNSNNTPDKVSDDYGVWTVKSHVVVRGGNWTSLCFEVPYDAETVPSEWGLLVGSDGIVVSWQEAMSEVDSVGIWAGVAGGGGVPTVFEFGVDNLRVFSGSRQPIAIPVLSTPVWLISLVAILLLTSRATNRRRQKQTSGNRVAPTSKPCGAKPQRQRGLMAANPHIEPWFLVPTRMSLCAADPTCSGLDPRSNGGIPSKETPMEQTVKVLPLNAISPRPGFNPRRHFDAQSMERLTESIRAQGVVQAITVRPRPDAPDQFEIIAGHRRHKAASQAGLSEIPAVIRNCDDRQALILATLENQEREDISPSEEALLARRVLDAFAADKDRAAKELGWSRTKLDARLLLLHADISVLDAVASGQITLGHAELLAGLPAQTQAGTLAKVVTDKIPVATLKERLKGFAIPLSQAIFDQSQCNGCPHNSQTQGSLFGEHLDGAQCQNRECYGEKIQAALEAKKAELAEEFHAVYLDTERDPDARRIVLKSGEGAVGPEQFSAGCANCKNFGCVVKTQLGPETGRVLRDVCFDPSCHAEKVAAHGPAKPPQRGSKGPARSKGSATQLPSTKKTATPKASVLTGKVTEYIQKCLIDHHNQVVANNEDVWGA